MDRLLWIYPWDVLDEGIEACFARCANEIGVETVSVAGLYHSGKFLLPRNPRRRVYFPEPGACYFQPTPSRYEKLRIQPIVSALAGDDAYRRIRNTASQLGLRFQAWILGFHNTGLGSQFPDACIANAYGDRYLFALCPANPEARAFVGTILEDVLATVSPDSLFLETHNYLNYVHGFHHEYTPAPTSELDRFLLSLCFCDHCQTRGNADGVDVDRLRSLVRETLDHRIHRYHDPDEWVTDDYEELTQFVTGSPEMAAYVETRKNTVTELTAEYADLAHARGADFEIVAALFARPSERAWMEGTDMDAQSRLSDRIVVLAYHVDLDTVRRDVEHALAAVHDKRKLRLALNAALPDTPSPESLEAKALYAAEQGARSFGFYNYGFLNEPRIQWVTNVIRRLDAHVKAASG
jgi:hypothetical protein